MNTAIILAAGRGSKLWPYGETWAKAALPIANRPLIQWQMDALSLAGINNTVVVTGHLGGQVLSAIGQQSNIQYVEQKKQSGTADALLLALSFVKDEEFLVLYGDVLFNEEDLIRLLNYPLSNGDGAALVNPLHHRPPHEWLCANVKNKKITQILGHPRQATHRLCGIYRFTRECIPALTQNPGLMTSVNVGNMPPQEAELAESVSHRLHHGKTIHAVENQGFFVDIDKPWHLMEANHALLEHQCALINENQLANDARIEDGAQIEGYVILGEGSFIGRDVKLKGNIQVGRHTKIIDGAIIGENCIIGDHTEIKEYCKIEANTSIGNSCIVGHGAEFGGLMMDGAYSFHYGEYWGVLGRSADLGAATVCGNLRFDDQETIHRVKGRREITGSPFANAAYLGDYTRTGVNAVLMPGVKVGCYSIIGAGVILNEDVSNNSLIYVKQELERKPWGPEKYGW